MGIESFLNKLKNKEELNEKDWFNFGLDLTFVPGSFIRLERKSGDYSFHKSVGEIMAYPIIAITELTRLYVYGKLISEMIEKYF